MVYGDHSRSKTGLHDVVLISFVAVVFWPTLGHTGSETVRPRFTLEPPDFVQFSNTSGGQILCQASGTPQPKVTWLLADGSSLSGGAKVRRVPTEGKLVFPPFRAEDFRQDVHAVVYRCAASNVIGTVVSIDVNVRGVVAQPYDVYVYDVYVTKGNSAVFKCHVPSFLRSFVQVTSWILDGNFVINKTDLLSDITSLKYIMTPDGDLYIRNVDGEKETTSFRCKTKHLLTGEERLSSTAGKLFVTKDLWTNVAPRIILQKPEVTTHIGDVVLIPCIVEGYPVPKKQWHEKQGTGILTPVEGNQQIQIIPEGLLIRSAMKSNSQEYVCSASNAAGSVTSETSVTVHAPLNVSIVPADLTEDVGKSVQMNCIISGYPVTSVQWLKDGNTLQTNEDIRITGNMLTITHVRPEDKGIYQCLVKNTMTSAQASMELKLGDTPPQFLATFEEQVIQPQSSLALQCSASGTPSPEVSWQLDGTVISKAQVRFSQVDSTVVSWLNKSRVVVEDGGFYQCMAANIAGSVAHGRRIYVYGPVAARTPTPEVSVVAGEDVSLNCPVVGYPLQNFIWEKGDAILPADFQQMVFENNGTLIISKVQRNTDQGNYRCRVSDDKGKQVTSNVELKVLVPPKIIPFSFQDDQFFKGMRAHIICAVSQGDVPLTFEWLKDGQPLPATLHVTTRDIDGHANSLSIESVLSAHTGNYTCIVHNKAAKVSHTAQLLVYVPPKWIIAPNNITALKDKSVSVPCHAEGFPNPTIQWMKLKENNQRSIVHSGNGINILQNGTLQIEALSNSHQGNYFCIASNGVGKGLSKVVYIKVQAPVYFDVKERKEVAKIGESITLKCEVNGDHPISFSWFHRNQELNGKSNRYKTRVYNNTSRATVVNELSVIDLVDSDAGNYTCTARNNYGSDTKTFSLVVQKLPATPEFAIRNIGNRSVELSWNPPADGNSPITKFILQYKKKQDSWQSRSVTENYDGFVTSAIIGKLLPATIYDFRLVAENGVGTSGYSTVMTIALGEEAPDGAPQQIDVEAIDPHSLRISWKPPKKNLWNGAIRGYHVGYRVYGSNDQYTFKTLEVPEDYTEDLIYQLSNLNMFTQYDVIIRAYNNGGPGPHSEEIVVMTSEDVPHEPPPDVRCSSLSSHSIYVVWEAPSLDATNGILRGYKVYYKPAEEWFEGSLRMNVSQAPKLTLQNLEVSTNYSIQVLAFTKVGDGVKSDPIFCKTHEDVPNAPADVKALAASSDSVLVAWKPPTKPNGRITKYNLYHKILEDGEEVDSGYSILSKDRAADEDSQDISVHSLDPEFNYFEVRRLSRDRRYAFWVTATSSIGEGPGSTVVTQTTAGNKVGAKSASFDGVIKTPWKLDVVMPCRAVGIPPPRRNWVTGAKLVQESERVVVRFDGSLMIKKSSLLDSGNYTCIIENIYGKDEVRYSVVVQVPPPAPELDVVSKSLSSVRLQWRVKSNGGDSVRGYFLNYKREFGQWEKKDFPAETEQYTVQNLSCGATYLIYLEAYNSVGVGSPCDIITVTTKGDAFFTPTKEDLIKEGITFITVNLDAWPPNSCPVLHFTAEYKELGTADWKMVASNYKPSSKKLVISGLEPATWYMMRLTAVTSGDSNAAEYMFATLSPLGGTIPPTIQKEEKVVLFYMDPWIFIPLVALIITIIIASVVVCVFLKRRKGRKRNIQAHAPTDWMQESGGLGQSRSGLGVSVESFIHMQRAAANQTLGRPGTMRKIREDPSPYATVHVPGFVPTHDMRMMAMDHRSIPPPLPPCPEIPTPTQAQRWLSQAQDFGQASGNFMVPTMWDQGYSSADGENIYATTRRRSSSSPENPLQESPARSIPYEENEETTFVFPNQTSEVPYSNAPIRGRMAGEDEDGSSHMSDQQINPQQRDPVGAENAWLLDQRLQNRI